MARPLTLHLSALSDDEYDLYTSSLSEISSPPSPEDNDVGYWENRIVSLREARGWMRGRYGVDGPVIDTILKMFSPTLGPADTLTSGQFFAAMRLVLYAQRGETPDRSLVFVQPPSTPKAGSVASTHSQQLSSSSDRSTSAVSNKGATAAGQQHSSPNPFHRSTTNSDPSSRRTPAVNAFPLSVPSSTATATTTGTGNPFVRHDRIAHPLPTPATSPTPSHFPLPSTTTTGQHSPPLPPRKPAFPPPPQRVPVLSSSTSGGSIRMSAANKSTPPPPPPKPAALAIGAVSGLGASGAAHHTSELIHKSLQAARTLGVQRRAETELAGARMLEVIRSTASSTSPTHTGSSELGTSPGTARRRVAPSPPASLFAGASETSSLERVATARFPRSTSRSPSPPSKPTSRLPPPLLRSATAQLPRSPFESDPSSPNNDGEVDVFPPRTNSRTPPPPGRTTRSLSVHGATGGGGTPTSTPPPIPRRPRPESLQLHPASPTTAPATAAITATDSSTSPGSTSLRRSVSAAAPSHSSHHSHRSAASLSSSAPRSAGPHTTTTGGAEDPLFFNSLRESFNSLGLHARERVHEARERIEGRHVARRGTKGENRGLVRSSTAVPREGELVGTDVVVDLDDDDDDEEEEEVKRARSGWRPLV